MIREIYLDHSATTRVSAAAKSGMEKALSVYANPSSLHSLGAEAAKLLRTSRETILSALGVRDPLSAQLIFTASGTEANNLALFGTAHAKERRTANRIVITDSEHPSVARPAEQLEKEGFEVVRVPTKGGILDGEFLDKVLDKNTLLVSLMTVNNETGALYDVASAFKKAKKRNPDVVTHTDFVQGFLKCKLTSASLSADLITLSGHKIGAPKGIGALYIDKKILTKKMIVPHIYGGGQENGLRSGTENMLGIAAFAEAAKAEKQTLSQNIAVVQELRAYLISRLTPLEVKLNLPKGEASPHIVNLTLPSIRSETMLHYLAKEGIFVSAGSACSSHAAHPSSALLSFGLTAEEAGYSIRVSLSKENTQNEIDTFLEILSSGLNTLVRTRR